MKVAFRVDANRIVATGHLIRCLSIAIAFKEIGCESVFISAENSGRKIVERAGFSYINLDTAYNELEKEIPVLLNYLSEISPEVVVTDSYYVNEEYLAEIKRNYYVVHIDDLNAIKYPVNLLVNYGIGAEQIDYGYLDRQNLLLGCTYAPLRKEFLSVGQKQICEKVKSILVLAGGGDSLSYIFEIAKKLLSFTELSDKSVHIVVGSFSEQPTDCERSMLNRERVVIHRNVAEMAELMKYCDVAVTAGGSTMYELCACGVPSVSYAFADNQMRNVTKFDELGLIDYCGNLKDSPEVSEKIAEKLESLCKDGNLRRQRSQEMQRFVDGNGARRIAEQVVKRRKS